MEGGTGDIRVLLVEDDAAQVDLIETHVQQLSDERYRVEACSTLNLAEQKLKHDAFDLILADLNLPDSQGINTITRLKAAGPHIPVIVLTGSSDQLLAAKCLAVGAEDYLRKAEVSPTTLRRSLGFALLRLREVQIRELTETLSRYRTLSSEGTSTIVTRTLAGAIPIHQQAPEVFREMVTEYREMFDFYLGQLVVRADKPIGKMSALANKLGALGGGPRDLIDVHLKALEEVIRGTSAARARACAVEGRLLALEMMGLLVDCYRLGVRRSRPEGDEA